jgi:uncharacterized protein
MKHVFPGRPGIFLLGLIVIALCGCASSPNSRFYILSSLKNPAPAGTVDSAAPNIIVAVGPVTVPDYLDKPGIVTRSGRNEINVSEFNRWAGDLESILSRTVIENLSALLPGNRFSVVRWYPGIQAVVPITYRLTLDIIRFDAVPGDAAILESGWMLYGGDPKPLLIRRDAINAPIKGTDYPETVVAMSKAIEDFSRTIADVIKSRNGT